MRRVIVTPIIAAVGGLHAFAAMAHTGHAPHAHPGHGMLAAVGHWLAGIPSWAWGGPAIVVFAAVACATLAVVRRRRG